MPPVTRTAVRTGDADTNGQGQEVDCYVHFRICDFSGPQGSPQPTSTVVRHPSRTSVLSFLRHSLNFAVTLAHVLASFLDIFLTPRDMHLHFTKQRRLMEDSGG